MTNENSNLVLIGMPGAGKSTVGVLLAKQTSRGFVDTDVLIQTEQGRTLQQIIDSEGNEALRRIEEQTLLGLQVCNHVIATGGSAVYSEAAMAHLRAVGVVVFLDVDLPSLEARVHNLDTRGLAKQPDQQLSDIYRERLPLYHCHADITIDGTGLTQESVCDAIRERLEESE